MFSLLFSNKSFFLLCQLINYDQLQNKQMNKRHTNVCETEFQPYSCEMLCAYFKFLIYHCFSLMPKGT